MTSQYKVRRVPVQTVQEIQTFEEMLNKMSADGWWFDLYDSEGHILVVFSRDPDIDRSCTTTTE
jgi:hypothetical protein